MGRIGLVVTLAALVGLACSGGGDGTEQPTPTPAPPEVAPAAAPSIAPAAADEPPAALELIKGPISEDGLQAIFATPDLGTGRHRVAFALTSRTGLIDAPTATVQSFYDPDPETETWGEPVQTALAVFRPFPIVERGLYATHLNFDRTGMWAIRATVFGDDGASLQASLVFDVPERTLAPAVGDTAPRSDNRTADDVERLSQLTTGSMQDPDLYRLTIAEAVDSGLPTVIVMASPAFCTNAVCGPQVEVLQELKDEFDGQANFIHVDYFDNPEEIQGDLTRAVVSPVAKEWGLPSTEWSFVVDRDGIVSGRFEGFTALEELRQALERAL